MQFTGEDFEILEEAIDAWIDKDAAGELLGGIMTAMLSPKDDPAGEKKMEALMDKKLQANKEAKAVRKRKAVLLKAKLYEIAAKTGADGIVGRITSGA